MVCAPNGCMVTIGVGAVVLAFFTRYMRPLQTEASGSVNVAAAVPVKTKSCWLIVAAVLVVKIEGRIDIFPLTSSVELGLVVPIPTPVCDQAPKNHSMPNKQ